MLYNIQSIGKNIFLLSGKLDRIWLGCKWDGNQVSVILWVLGGRSSLEILEESQGFSYVSQRNLSEVRAELFFPRTRTPFTLILATGVQSLVIHIETPVPNTCHHWSGLFKKKIRHNIVISVIYIFLKCSILDFIVIHHVKQ